MRIFTRLMASILLVTAITACNTNNDDNAPNNNTEVTDPSNNENNENNESHDTENEHNQANDQTNTDNDVTNEDPNLTQKDIIDQIAQQETTSFSFDLPTELPIDEGKQLTGKTSNKDGAFEVVFYQSDENIPVNDERLNNNAEKIARLHIQQYDNEEAADEEIGFEDFSDAGGEEVDLGHDLTGYQDAGAGSLFTSWNEGRWAMATRTTTDNTEEGVTLAKDAVDYLESQTLPAPHEHGHIQLDTDKDGTIITWQDGKIVYTIDETRDSLEALEIATTFK